jgi:hypothetical protein
MVGRDRRVRHLVVYGLGRPGGPSLPAHPSKSSDEVMVNLVVAELLFEGVTVDDGQFEVGDCSEVFHGFELRICHSVK